MSKAETVKVAVRCRPINSKEKADGHYDVVTVDSSRNQILVKDPNDPDASKQRTFTFDYAYGSNSTQKQVYEQCASGIVASVIEGYNGTLFAYGQTGTGKTHTMEGDRNSSVHKGIIPRSFEHLFTIIKGTTDKQFLVRCSMLEIYNEEVRDLLNKSDEKLKLRRTSDGTVFVEQLSSHEVKDDVECMKLLDKGSKNKEVASTDMNERSSRSHCIFTLIVESSKAEDDGREHITKGKLNLVDLAGSERQKKTKATGKQFKEACKINQSLVTLGNVIQALVEKGGSGHVPYRDSNLTILLEDSLGGNAKTVMLAAIGPANYNFDETCNTLRYADRAKKIKNAPKINENPKDAKIREMRDEIEILKKRLAEQLKGIKGFNINELMAAGGEGHDDQMKLLEQQIRDEEEELEKQADLERKKIAEMQNIDKKKRDELMANLKTKQELVEKERKEKENILKELKEKEERLLIGSKKNQEELFRYNQELESMKKEAEEKARRQEEMQREIANAQSQAEELTGKVSSNKGNIKLKQQTLEKLKRAIEQQKNQLERMKDDHDAGTKDYKEEIKDKQKMLKLYHLLMNFVPKEYRDFIIRSSEAEKSRGANPLNFQVPNRHMAGNKIMEEYLNGKAKLINAWREGNDPVIAYSSDDRVERGFYQKLRPSTEMLDETEVRIEGKVVPDQKQAADD